MIFSTGYFLSSVLVSKWGQNLANAMKLNSMSEFTPTPIENEILDMNCVYILKDRGKYKKFNYIIGVGA